MNRKVSMISLLSIELNFQFALNHKLLSEIYSTKNIRARKKSSIKKEKNNREFAKLLC